MKKLISVFAAVLLLFAVPVQAEDYNLDAMTLDELAELRRLINAEINERLAETEMVFYPFDYAVGTDIPAGRYIVTGVFAEGNYILIKCYQAGTEVFTTVESIVVGEECTLTLKEGDILRLSGGTVTIRPYIVPTF